MSRLPPGACGAFRLLLRLLPRAEREDLTAAVLEGVEEGWRDRRRRQGLVGALGFLAREWLDLSWNVAAARWPRLGPGRLAGGRGGGVSMEGIWFDVRLVARGLRRSPALVAGAVITLGVAIGANLALFSVLHGVLLRPLPYGDPSELVALYTQWDETHELGLTWKEVAMLDAEAGTLESVAGTLLPGMDTRFVLEGPDGREVVEAVRVSPNFFQVLGVGPQIGSGVRASAPLDQVEPVVLLSDAAWRRRWGADPAMVGGSVRITGQDYRVAGILPSDFSFDLAARAPELYLVQTPSEVERNDDSNPIVQPVARLEPGADVADAAQELTRLAPAMSEARPPDAPDALAGVRPLREHLVGDVTRPLVALGFAALLVLIVACANLAALFLARHTEREMDQALRAALGAGRDRLVRLPIVEAVALGLAGGVLGLGLAALFTDRVLAGVPASLFRYEGFEPDLAVGLFAVSLSVLAGLLFGGLPAWRSGRARPAEALRRRGTRGATGGTNAPRLLAGAEAAALMVLLVATGLSLRSLDALLDVDLGFRSEGRATATLVLPPGRYDLEALGDLVNRVEERLEALPGVRAAGTVSHLPLDPDNWGGSLTVESEDAEGGAPTVWELASPGYFEAAGIEVLRGRSFARDDGPSTPRVTVVSRTLARMIRPSGPLERVVGTRISGTGPEGPWLEVIGVVEDVRQGRIGEESRPHMYVSHAQMFPFPERELVLATEGVDPLAALHDAVPVLRELQPDIVVTRMRTLDSIVSEALGWPRAVSSLLGILGMAALVLALSGIYGITAFAVARRRREIGIRACLGAARHRLFGRALAEALVPVGIGVLVGLGVVMLAAPRVEGLLYGVDPLDLPTLLSVPGLLLAAAAATAWRPALRAARLDPVEVLGEE